MRPPPLQTDVPRPRSAPSVLAPSYAPWLPAPHSTADQQLCGVGELRAAKPERVQHKHMGVLPLRAARSLERGWSRTLPPAWNMVLPEAAGMRAQGRSRRPARHHYTTHVVSHIGTGGTHARPSASLARQAIDSERLSRMTSGYSRATTRREPKKVPQSGDL